MSQAWNASNPPSQKLSQPYPGLRPFERHESKIFFGRDASVLELLARLRQRHFLAVLGSSGSGKSSLVKAGLLPALAKGRMGDVARHWSIAELRPGAEPFERLAAGLLQDDSFRAAWLGGGEAQPQAQGFLAAALRRGPLSLDEILARSPLPATTKLVLVVDQFEELFRYLNQDEAAAFVALLLHAAAHPAVYLVITMRSDFLGRAAAFEGLPAAINDGLYLTPRLSREQLEAAIRKPAWLFGGAVEEALVNAVCNETGHDPDQLPLLQHALMRLWHLDPAHRLSLQAYRDLGGLQGALDGHANQAWHELGSAAQAKPCEPQTPAQRIAMLMFRALSERGGVGEDTRRPAKASEIMALANISVDVLAPVVEAFSRPGRNFLLLSPPGELSAATTLDISHESLIRQWQCLQAWVAAEADKAAMLRRLSEAAVRHAKGQGEPWYGMDLSLALQWHEDEQPTAAWAARYLAQPESARQAGGAGQPAGIAPETPVLAAAQTGLFRPTASAFQQAMAFLRDSQAEEQRLAQEQEAARQAKIRLARRIALSALLGLVLALGLAGWAVWERHHAQQAEWQRTRSLFDDKLTHASLLARIEDYAGSKALLQQTRELDAQIEPPRRHARDLLAGFAELMGGAAEPTYTGAGVALLGNLAASPDGHWLAVGGEQGRLVLVDRASGKLSWSQAHEREVDVYALAFHPTQPWLYSGGEDGHIRRWGLNSGGLAAPRLAEWKVDAGAVASLALSPDGAVLASGHADGKIRLWQAGSGQPLRVLSGHKDLIASGFGLAFSPDGRRLASAAYDGTARIWDVGTGNSLRELAGHTGAVYGVAFSPDGSLLATAGKDQSIRIWDAASGQSVRILAGHGDKVWNVQFLPGRRLASSSDDRTVRLWDLDSGATLRVLQGHAAGVAGLALPPAAAAPAPAAPPEPAQAALYSASKDGTLKRWALDGPGQWLLPLPGEPASAALHPDGTKLVLGYADGSLRVYALPGSAAQPLKLLHEQTVAHKGDVQRLVFAASGQRLASAGFDKLAKLWRVEASGSLREEKVFAGHKRALHGLAFTPDGSRLASASYDGQIGLFGLDGEAKTLFPAHEGMVMSVLFSADGQSLFSAGDDRQLLQWDLASTPPRVRQRFPAAADTPLWASLSPDGRWLAAVGRGGQSVRLYPVDGGAGYALPGHQQTVLKALFSPDSRLLATVSSDTTLRLWDLESRAELFRLRLPTAYFKPSPVWDFDFRCTPTGCWLAVPLVRKMLALYHLGPWRE